MHAAALIVVFAVGVLLGYWIGYREGVKTMMQFVDLVKRIYAWTKYKDSAWAVDARAALKRFKYTEYDI
jgi:hypothetical protein